MAVNTKLGWATAGAIAWAYVGLAAALGPGSQAGRPPVGMEIGRGPESVVIPGRLRELIEEGSKVRLLIETPDGQPTEIARGIMNLKGEPAGEFQLENGEPVGLPGQLPEDVHVEFIEMQPGEPRMPRILTGSGAEPFKLPRGGMGVIAGRYFIRITQFDVSLIPKERVKESLHRLKDKQSERREWNRGEGKEHPGFGGPGSHRNPGKDRPGLGGAEGPGSSREGSGDRKGKRPRPPGGEGEQPPPPGMSPGHGPEAPPPPEGQSAPMTREVQDLR